jgi:DNA (cytosine-5)-methyltransferase 1
MGVVFGCTIGFGGTHMTVLSLFSGAMGLDLGLEAAGFNTVACADSDATCRKTISVNRPEMRVFEDVTEVTKGMDEPLIVSGGPPCQSWSTMGRRLGFSDPRGLLVMEFGRVVRELLPRFFVMENVKGLASMSSPDGRLALSVILDEFKETGYKTVHGVVDAVNYGTPQFRERLLVIGSRDDEGVFLPEPTHFRRHQDATMRWKTLGGAIRDLEEDPGEYSPFSPKRAKWLEKIPPGANWNALSDEEKKEAMGGAFLSGGGKTGFFRRLTYEEPCPTLVTSPAQKSTLLCHPANTRPLSTREYARVQQFPDSWTFEGSLPDTYRQLGNAVPVGLGAAIGRMLKSVMDGGHTVKAARLREGVKKAPRVTEDQNVISAGRAAFGFEEGQ